MKKDSVWKPALLFFIAWLILAAIQFAAFKATASYCVATFDQPALVARFVGQLSAHTLSDEALAKKTSAFSAALKTALTDYASTHHVLVLSEKTVLSGENDITDAIAVMVAERMRGKS